MVTAAHCVYDKDGEMISERTLCVLLGLHDRTKLQHQEQGRWDTLQYSLLSFNNFYLANKHLTLRVGASGKGH